MDGLEELLLQHFARYPAMQPQDAVKLLYQRELGGGHLIADPEDSLARLRSELEATPVCPEQPCREGLGKGRARLYLAAPVCQTLPPELLNRLFVRSAGRGGSMQALRDSLETLRALAQGGRTPFSAAALETYLEDYLAAGCPLVSHSDAYRAAYHPAYRVMDEACARAVPLLALLAQRPDTGRVTVLAIDGRAASGKSTLAALLEELPGAGVVHMDDFFLPQEKRTPERLAEPGGNVDYERFACEVLPRLRSPEAFSYRRFDCSRMELGGERQVPAGRLRIVEGAYSCHPYFGAYADLRVFSDIAPEEQRARIALRDGERALANFTGRWIPMEERYLQAFAIAQQADLCL